VKIKDKISPFVKPLPKKGKGLDRVIVIPPVGKTSVSEDVYEQRSHRCGNAYE